MATIDADAGTVTIDEAAVSADEYRG